jgi:hypothetical protein
VIAHVPLSPRDLAIAVEVVMIVGGVQCAALARRALRQLAGAGAKP